MYHTLSLIKYTSKNVRLMFTDEAIFGRINGIVKCWTPNGVRPIIPRLKIREFRYMFGAAEPKTGESCFLIFSHCDTVCMNAFLKHLSEQYPDDHILLVCDNAGWHKSNNLQVPDNITITHIPPCTPEMNPMEQIWDEIKEKWFSNQFFPSLKKVCDRMCEVVCGLANDVVRGIMCRNWICEIFN